MSSIDQQFIDYIIKSLVGHPDDVKIERRIDEKGVLLELSVHPEDLGRVIGKRGATAQSIRTLLRALGTKNDARYNLKIIDTGPPPERREQRTESREPEPEPVGASTTADDDDSSTSDDATDTKAAPDEEEKVEAKEEAKTIEPEPAKESSDVDMIEDEELPEKPAETEDHSDVVSRTRKELADLDDLDL